MDILNDEMEKAVQYWITNRKCDACRHQRTKYCDMFVCMLIHFEKFKEIRKEDE